VLLLLGIGLAGGALSPASQLLYPLFHSRPLSGQGGIAARGFGVGRFGLVRFAGQPAGDRQLETRLRM
jgi:hypothetical protein